MEWRYCSVAHIFYKVIHKKGTVGIFYFWSCIKVNVAVKKRCGSESMAYWHIHAIPMGVIYVSCAFFVLYKLLMSMN